MGEARKASRPDLFEQLLQPAVAVHLYRTSNVFFDDDVCNQFQLSRKSNNDIMDVCF